MSDISEYFQPITRLAVFDWHFKLVTPMLIRSTEKAYICQSPIRNDPETRRPKKIGKAKGKEMEFTIEPQTNKEKWADVTLPNLEIVFVDDKPELRYAIPPSSIRGAIRNWVINQLVEDGNRDAFIMLKKDDYSKKEQKQHREHKMELVTDKNSGWPYIINLFGYALDTGDETAVPPNVPKPEPGRAGRLRFSGGKLNDNYQNPRVQGEWKKGVDHKWDPPNARRHVKMRNPLDRITMASKDGGLHSFIEFAPDMEFSIKIELRQPELRDLLMFAVCRHEIEEGMIRFGALSAAGRGRVSVLDSSSNKIYVMKNQSVEFQNKFKAVILEQTALMDEAIDTFFDCYAIDLNPDKLADVLNSRKREVYYE